MALSREHIAAQAAKPKLDEYHVPAWADENGDDLIYLRGMTGDEAEEFQERASQAGEDVKKPNSRGLIGWVVRPCIVDADGQSLFPNEEDAALIGKLQFRELNGIGMRILRLSGLTDAGQDDIGGNSSAGKTGETESDSPESTTTAPTTNS